MLAGKVKLQIHKRILFADLQPGTTEDSCRVRELTDGLGALLTGAARRSGGRGERPRRAAAGIVLSSPRDPPRYLVFPPCRGRVCADPGSWHLFSRPTHVPS